MPQLRVVAKCHHSDDNLLMRLERIGKLPCEPSLSPRDETDPLIPICDATG